MDEDRRASNNSHHKSGWKSFCPLLCRGDRFKAHGVVLQVDHPILGQCEVNEAMPTNSVKRE